MTDADATTAPAPAAPDRAASGAMGYMPTLDGWRAIALLLVLAHHWHVLPPIGHMGVTIFFCLSGYLLSSRLLTEHELSGHFSLGQYFLRRIMRIWPTLLVYLIVLAYLAYSGAWFVTREEWAATTLFYRNYVPHDGGSWYTAHCWTLAVEEQFYIILPFLLLVPAVRKRIWVLPLVCVGITVWRLIGWHDFVNQTHNPEWRTDTRGDALLWGVWLGTFLRDPERRARATRWLTPGVWVTALALLFLSRRTSDPLALTLHAFCVPTLIIGTLLHPEWRGSRFLETPIMRWLAAISFPTYMFQQLLVPDENVASDSWQYILPIGIAIHYLIELPGIDVGRTLIKRRWREFLRPRLALVSLMVLGGLATVVHLGITLSHGAAAMNAQINVFVDANYRGGTARLGPGRYDLSQRRSGSSSAISALFEPTHDVVPRQFVHALGDLLIDAVARSRFCLAKAVFEP